MDVRKGEARRSEETKELNGHTGCSDMLLGVFDVFDNMKTHISVGLLSSHSAAASDSTPGCVHMLPDVDVVPVPGR